MTDTTNTQNQTPVEKTDREWRERLTPEQY
jgi:hypothetical protein